MEFFNFHVSVMDDERFAAAEHEQRSVWLHVMRYCIGQENGGRIIGCRTWSNKKLMVLCRVFQKELLAPSELWSWEGDDLIVWSYPLKSQKKLQDQRKTGSDGGSVKSDAKAKAARENGAKHKGKSTQGENESSSDNNPSETQAEPKQNPSRTQGSSDSKPNVREGKVREGNNNTTEGGDVEADEAKQPKQTSQTQPEIHPRILDINSLKGRRDDTVWSKKEIAAFEALGLADLSDESWAETFDPLAAYYAAPLSQLRRHWGQAPDGTADYRRRDIQTLLNNWAGEVDRARAFGEWLEKIRAENRAGLLVGDTV